MATSIIQSNRSDRVINASSNILNVLSEGLNAILIEANTPLGQVTAPNNMRGVAIRNGNTVIGFITNYNGTLFYVIGNNETSAWAYAEAH